MMAKAGLEHNFGIIIPYSAPNVKMVFDLSVLFGKTIFPQYIVGLSRPYSPYP
jgi:hypothetical protein